MVMMVVNLLAGDALTVKCDALVRVVVGVVNTIGHCASDLRFEEGIRRIMSRRTGYRRPRGNGSGRDRGSGGGIGVSEEE